MNRMHATGDAGILGSGLCEQLLARGHDVLCVDNFSTGVKRNVSHFLTNPHFESMGQNATLPRKVKAGQICNLACPTSPLPV